jgi:hypothetical protein
MLYWTDARRGVVLQMFGKEIREISSFNMKDYFRDMFRAGINKQKVGAYDPYRQNYVLSTNDSSVLSCSLKIYPDSAIVSKDSGIKLNVFKITTTSDWNIILEDTGWGTSWVTNISPEVSEGDALVSFTLTANVSAYTRQCRVVVNYCEGKQEIFTLIQAKGKTLTVGVVAVNNFDYFYQRL